MRYALTIFLTAALILSGSAHAVVFEDVTEGQWYNDAVTEAVSLGLIYGYPDGHFKPNFPISHAEFVTIVSRGTNLGICSPQTEHWASETMAAALSAGWYDWDEIPPTGENYDAPIPRKVAARILAAAYLPEVHGDYSVWSAAIKDFQDLDGRYYEPVFALYESGLAEGGDNGNFNPNKSLTRAEACTLIVKALRIKGDGIQPTPVPQPVSAIKGGVSENGFLQVRGTQLCAENGEPVVLHGMSSHGIQWYSNYTAKGAIKATSDYGANVFRAAMYTAENGYISNNEIKTKVFNAIDAAIELDMYAVIDWHILSDGNPQTYKEQAKQFFGEVAKRYAENPAVIYEICNEPNGNVSWQNDIRPYAMEIIPIIRKHSPNAIILVGSGTWSQDIHTISQDPLPFDNIMYTLHFYAGTHHDFLRNRLVDALRQGTPIFVSEWGTSDASGGGGVYLDQSKIWLDLLDTYGISWINWSLCDKNESSAALNPGASPNGNWKAEDLSKSGAFVFGRF